MQYIFVLIEVGFCPPIGLIGADVVDLEIPFMNLLVVSDTYICEDVGNYLLVKNGGRNHVLLAHMEHLGEAGWKRRPVEFQT